MILIIAEYVHGRLHSNTRKVITAASHLNCPIEVIVVGHNVQSIAEEAAFLSGVSKVKILDDAAYASQLPDNTAKAIAQVANSYQYILAASSSFGKGLLPRIAALLNVNQLSDVQAILSNDTFQRPQYAGNILATVQSFDIIKVMTIRLASFKECQTAQFSCAIEVLNIPPIASKMQWLGIEENKSARPELGSAKIIVSGGRGMQSQENFKLIEALADKLGAAIGASRAAVDAGFVPNDYQVGQTGKIVAPELYIAIGISGAIQHLAGMKDSKIIVAINKDPDAPIFQIADYGLVGDLFEIVPEFIKII